MGSKFLFVLSLFFSFRGLVSFFFTVVLYGFLNSAVGRYEGLGFRVWRGGGVGRVCLGLTG